MREQVADERAVARLVRRIVAATQRVALALPAHDRILVATGAVVDQLRLRQLWLLAAMAPDSVVGQAWELLLLVPGTWLRSSLEG